MEDYEFHKSGVFCIGVISTLGWVMALIYGYYSDYLEFDTFK